VQLSKTLAPNSSFHASATPIELKVTVQPMKELKERLESFEHGQIVSETIDFCLAHKGLLQPAAPPKPAAPSEKPSLEVGDVV
jgi:hypothetical protein